MEKILVNKQKILLQFLIGATSSYLSYLYFSWLWDGIITLYGFLAAILTGAVIVLLLHPRRCDASSVSIIISAGIGGLWITPLGTFYGVSFHAGFGALLFSFCGHTYKFICLKAYDVYYAGSTTNWLGGCLEAG